MNQEYSVATKTAQVVVVGAGPAGSSVAAGLATQGVDVLLLDKANFPREKVCGDGLTPRSVHVLQEMGLIQQIMNAGALRIDGVRIHAPNGQPVEARFADLSAEYPPYGLTIPRHVLDTLLLENAELAGARFLGGFRVRKLIRAERGEGFGGVQGLLDGHTVLVRAPLTILATGATMPLVQQAGLLTNVPPVVRATRGYYRGVPDIEPIFHFYFDRDFMPGYGWVFPLSDGLANVGTGYFPGGQFRRQNLPARRLFDRFVEHNLKVKRQLSGGTPVETVKSYPLRTDFATMRTQTGGLVLVGEAAGLVNPINGEGVDYALESGQMAAELLARPLKEGRLTDAHLEKYEEQLSERYFHFFYYLAKMRDVYFREWVFNLLVRKAQARADIKYLFVNAALGLINPREGLSLRTLTRILF
jgi:geranylgeranyl reductase family protein